MLTKNNALPGQKAKVLSESGVGKIHDKVLETLEKIGCDFQDESALEIFRSNKGASVEGSRVRFTPKLVEWAIEQAPGKFTLRARNPENDIPLGDGQIYYTSAFGATFICDREQKTYRKALLDDAADYFLLADKLENVHYVLTAIIPQDMPVELAEMYIAALQFSNSEKHADIGTPNSDYVDEIWEMGQLVAEDSGVEGPLYSLGCTINSPLVYTHEALPKLIHAAKRNIPFKPVSGTLAGALSPVTLAGTLVVQNAEILAGLILSQLVNPGCPIEYGTFSGGMDMRTGKWGAGRPEMSLITGASAQFCELYDIPYGYGTGGVSDSRVPDVRAGFEKGLQNMAAALCGVEVIHDGVSGLLGGLMAISFEQMIIDNEIAKWVNHFLRGIPVDEDALAMDVITNVGPGGHVLEEEHTLKNFKKEHLISPLLSSEYQLEYPASESEDIVFQAGERAQEILDNHRPTELDPTAKKGIQAILTRLGGERILF